MFGNKLAENKTYIQVLVLHPSHICQIEIFLENGLTITIVIFVQYITGIAHPDLRLKAYKVLLTKDIKGTFD